MEDRWLSVEQIADYLGVSKDTVYAWITTKGMPAHRVGRLWKFKKEAVDDWVQSGGANAVENASGAEGQADHDRVIPGQGNKKTRTRTRRGKAR